MESCAPHDVSDVNGAVVLELWRSAAHADHPGNPFDPRGLEVFWLNSDERFAGRDASVRAEDEERTRQLRLRYLALLLDGMRPSSGAELPGPKPTWDQVRARWRS